MEIVKNIHVWDDANLIDAVAAKANLRVDHALDDGEIAVMIKAAYLAVQNHINRVLLNSTITYQTPGSNNSFAMKLNNVASFKSFGAVTAIGTDGVAYTPTGKTIKLNGDTVEVSNVVFSTDVDVNHWQIAITYEPTILDEAINSAVFLTITHMYEDRNAVVVGTIASPLPMGVKNILSTYRNIPV